MGSTPTQARVMPTLNPSPSLRRRERRIPLAHRHNKGRMVIPLALPVPRVGGRVPVGRPVHAVGAGPLLFCSDPVTPRRRARWARPAGVPTKGIARPDAPPDLASGETGEPLGPRRAEGGTTR